jgi:predicted Fe-Mo cluster-binding NifX family protein
MSRAAIATWQGHVATTLDFAKTLLLVDLIDGKVAARREISLAGFSPLAIVGELEAVGARVMICGAISAYLWSAAKRHGIQIIPFVKGDIEAVIQGCLHGTLGDERFHMAGYRPQRYRRKAGPRRGCHGGTANKEN